MAVKVIGAAFYTSTQRVLAAIYEKGVEYRLEPLDIMGGAHKKPDHLALHPFGQIPVIQDQDLTLFETRAIIRYIAEKHKGQGTPLFGKNLKEKAIVEQWLAVEVEEFNGPISTAIFQLVFGPVSWGIPTDESLVSDALQKLGKVLDAYEKRLSDCKYLAGDFFSLADLAHLPYLHQLINVAKRGEMVKSRKHVYAWWEDISCRPAWKNVLELA
ncbi:hypothetical protein O6H91_05G002600 [Diphasiastrum complanatum]|uniref:Uncharacterized protein n=1 Tax=Diphasiastrum complanatum TaxID=34168 RepID=A0ACC2DKL8_DIPCM|nr:hypothetical protein O6H91_05G002600 [Diphasiastrum complanatum]